MGVFGTGKKPEDEGELEPERDAEQIAEDTVLAWRFGWAVRLGYGPREARRVARSKIEYADLKRLIDRGCELDTAYRILR